MDRKLKLPVHFCYNKTYMARNTFTPAEQELLRKNQYILRVSKTNVTYKNEFKVIAVERSASGLSPQRVFVEAGLPVHILGERARHLIRDWRKIHKSQGVGGLINSTRGKSKNGGRPKKERVDTSKMSLAEQVEYYKTKSEYFENANAFFREARRLPQRRSSYGPKNDTQ